MPKSNPKSRKACSIRKMKWVARHKSKSAKGKSIKVRGSCRKKSNMSRSMLGSKFLPPFCPDGYSYSDDKRDGGKVCIFDKDGTKLEIQKDGKPYPFKATM